MNLKVLFMCGMVALFGSCASDDPENCPEVSTTPKEVNFRINKELATRAGKTEFAEGDAIGIFAVVRTDEETVALPGATGNQAHNVKYVKTETGWEAADIEEKIVWPQNGEALDFYAYWPYSEDAVDPEAIVFALSDMAESDVLRAANTKGLTEGEVELSFSHVFAMLEVEVVGEESSADLELTVKATNVLKQAKWNIGTDAFEFTEEIGGVMQLTRTDESKWIYQTILLPQTIVSGNEFIQCVYDDTYTYKAGQDIVFEAGKKQGMKITLK